MIIPVKFLRIFDKHEMLPTLCFFEYFELRTFNLTTLASRLRDALSGDQPVRFAGLPIVAQAAVKRMVHLVAIVLRELHV
jgi:hypothetical protein